MLIISKHNRDPSFQGDIERESVKNTYYRKVLFTSKNLQLVLMSLNPGEEIGSEVHDVDQFFRFEEGVGCVIVNDQNHDVSAGDVVIVPQGCKHNVINTSSSSFLKIYSIYAPPHHKRGTIHKTKAEEKEEHFDGKTDVYA